MGASGLSDDVAPKGRVLFGEHLVDFLRTWGSMEQTIDGCVSLIYRYHDGRSVSTVNYTTIERKVGFLRLCAKIPSVAPYASLIEEMAEIVMVEKAARNHIVHGWPVKIEKSGTAHIVLMRPNYENPEHILRVVDRKEWARLEKACFKVSALGLALTFGLLPEDVGRNEIENVSREWFEKGASLIPASKKVRDLYKEVLALDPKD